ncbi:MAG: hypothetical protein IJT18_04240 [Oscillospiraceae bacterium]|nr:hypothetical protein [Oscillospiraceae bacterium]
MRLTIILFMILLVLTSVCAAVEITERQANALPLDQVENALPDRARELVGGISPTSPPSFTESAGRILRDAVRHLGDFAISGARTCACMLLIVLLCCVVRTGSDAGASRAALVAGSAAICLCFIGNMRSMASLGSMLIDSYATFTEALFPVLSAAAAASGATSSSAAIYAVAVFFFQLLIRAIRLLLLPLLYAYLALSVADAALSERRLTGWKTLIGGLIKGTLRVLVFAFVAFLSVTGVTSGSVDALSLKAAKLTISSTVPMVGSMVSDASESVLTSAALLKNSIGAFGMLSVLAIGAIPLLQIAVQYLQLRITEAVCGVFGEKPLCGLVSDTASVMGYLFAMCCVCALLVFLSCICFMRGFVP